MNRTVIVLWGALLATIALMATLAYVWHAQRAQMARGRVEQLLQLQLQPYRQTISQVFDDSWSALDRQANQFVPQDLQACVQLRRSPLVDDLVVIDGEDQLHYPRDPQMSVERQSLVDEALQLLRENTSADSMEEPQDSSQLSAALSVATAGEVPPGRFSIGQQRSGWVTWYHRRGMLLGYWWEQPSGWKMMAILPRARWISDIVAALPAAMESTSPARSASASLAANFYRLVDVEGQVIHQWGEANRESWPQLGKSTPTAVIAVAEPLSGWRLQVFANARMQRHLAGDSVTIPLLVAVAALAVSLLIAGAWLTLSLNRQLRLAASRVSFVNQVSHELRTPLTNIRMYADLLAQALDEQGAEELQRERVAVIQGESQRLSRLIGNVLQFARPVGQRDVQPDAPPDAHRAVASLDELVTEVVATFRPRLQRLGFHIDLDLQAAEPRLLPVDAVEQILVNLIGNAEKYAAAGGYLRIATRSEGDQIVIEVADAGPGIPASQRKRVFEPFVRLCDRLEFPAGTGIGLTIVRRLAHEHGGQCVVLPSAKGAVVQCALQAQRV